MRQIPQSFLYLLLPFWAEGVVRAGKILFITPGCMSCFPFILLHMLAPFHAFRLLRWLALSVRSPKRSRLGAGRLSERALEDGLWLSELQASLSSVWPTYTTCASPVPPGARLHVQVPRPYSSAAVVHCPAPFEEIQ